MTNPSIHGLRNAYAAHVSGWRKAAAQRRALRRRPGAGGVATVATRFLEPRDRYLAALIACCASLCAWFSAARGDCCPASTRLTASIQAVWNSALAGDAGML